LQASPWSGTNPGYYLILSYYQLLAVSCQTANREISYHLTTHNTTNDVTMHIENVSLNFLSLFLRLLLRTHCRCRGLLMYLITHSDTHTHTLGRIPLDESSAYHRDFYLTTYHNFKRQISMTLAGFEPEIAASEGRQSDALDRAATGIGFVKLVILNSSPSSEAEPLNYVSNSSDLNLILPAVTGIFHLR
jgi:hypothetical protein